jgi:hypothetical protein
MIFAILVTLSLAISLLIETSSWCVRAYSGSGNLGSYISKTNIYLYGGRFFAIATQVLIGYLVDSGAVPSDTLGIFLFGFLLTIATHVLFLGKRSWRKSLEYLLLKLMRLQISASPSPSPSVSRIINKRLFIATTLVSTFFALALMAPLVLASAFPEYRLTLNNSGSLINFFGMLLLLAYLDPMMYKALDDGTFGEKVESYIWGRIAGFAICASLLAVVLLSLYDFRV